MKNTSLKKIGAIALAAVMAVTFAPAASLDVFAADLQNGKTVAKDGDSLIGPGSYTVTPGATVGISVGNGTTHVAAAAGTYEIDLDGCEGGTVTISLPAEAKDADVVIKDSQDDGDYVKLVINNGATQAAAPVEGTNYKSLTIGEGFDFGAETNPTTLKYNKDGGKAVGEAPVAKVNDTYFIGNKAISVATKALSGTKAVKAENGAVVIDRLNAGSTAEVDITEIGATAGTTIAVTSAAKNTSLAKVSTSLSYTYLSSPSATITNGKPGNGDVVNGSGTATFSYDKYFAGSAKVAGTLQAIPTVEGLSASATNVAFPVVAKEAPIAKTDDSIYVLGIPSYTQTIDVKIDKDWVSGTNYLQAQIAENTNAYEKDSKPDGVTGMTWFTADPTKYVNTTAAEGNDIAVIDGDKYVIGSTGLASISKFATKTIEYTTVAKKTGENQDLTLASSAIVLKAPEAYNITRTVSKCAETAGSTAITEYVSGNVTSKEQEATVTSANGAVADHVDNYSTKETHAAVNSRTLYVDQVSKGNTLSVDGLNKDVEVDRASGIGYYRIKTPKTADPEYDYVFGDTKTITNEYTTKLVGGKVGNTTVNATPAFTDGTNNPVFASKEITVTVENLNKAAVLEGEISATYAKNADGTRNWVVNGGNINVPQNVYRLRAKVGNNHLYTMDSNEANNAVASGNWVIETSEAFKMLPSNTTVEGAVKVLRFRNVKTNEFLFSTDPAEQAAKLADPEWAEGYVAFCGVKDNTTGYPVTRLFSTIGQGHLYSTAQAEVKNAVEKDHYVKDGVVFFALETPEKEK